MGVIKGLEWTFDTVAAAYEKLRPGYVEELYQTIFDYIPINASSNVIEVGIGGGQATLPVLQTGANLTAVEYGPHLAELCREKFQAYPNFSVVIGKFEDAHFENHAYDLVFSASAFHWVPEEIGYSKVFSMLKSGGAFARFANHPYGGKADPALWAEIQKVYAKYYYKYYNNIEPEIPQDFREEEAHSRALIAEKYGFTDIRHALFYRTRTFTAKEYLTLLGTYSDHIAIPEPIRMEFFERIEQTIDLHGGKLTLHDTIDLQLARKP